MSANTWIWIRRLTQAFFFVLTVVLVVSVSDLSSDPVSTDAVGRSSPLLALTSMLTSRSFLLLFWPAFVVAAASVVLGRVFCGWACPLGTLFDVVDSLLARVRPKLKKEPDVPPSMPSARAILVMLLVLSLFGYSLSGWFDPLSLLPRTLSVAVLPGLENAIGPLFGFEGIETVRKGMSEDLPGSIATAVTGGPSHGQWLVVAILGTLLLLGLVRRRFYCRYLCPTGAFIGLLSRVPLLRRRVDVENHKACALCRNDCRMGAISGDDAGTRPDECILCLSCRSGCATDSISFRFDGWGSRKETKPATSPLSRNRREFMVSTASGVAAGLALDFHSPARTTLPLIRPPGARVEREFLDLCVSCGACVRTCPTNGLTLLQPRDGFLTLWTPVLVSRKGYCQWDCNRCAEACPSSAIQRLETEERKKAVIGIAELDRKRCLAWTGESKCSICVKLCPVHPKAIEMIDEAGTRPAVVDSLCVGCGICEYVCPVGGEAAIVIRETPGVPKA